MKVHESHAEGYKPRKIHHRVAGAAVESIREVILGAEDGFVSCLGVLTGIATGTGDRFVVILSGFLVAIVEAISMGAGSYLSSKSESEVAYKKLKDEMKEIEEEPEKEAKEFRDFFSARGFGKEEIEILLKRAQKNKKFMLEIMAYMELGVIPHHHYHVKPFKDAAFMFIFNAMGGVIPLLPYFFVPVKEGIFYSVLVSTLGLFIIGAAVKGRIVEKKWYISGGEMVLVSLSAAFVGFLIGRIVAAYFGVHPIL